VHPLEQKFRLKANEILDAISSRFRLLVAVEGRIAEVHLRKKLEQLQQKGVLLKFEEHDKDGYPDFTIWPAKTQRPLLIECKNTRGGNSKTHARVEVQKTRAAKSDPSSRYYEQDHFQILAVCLGKQTGNYQDFVFVKSGDLARHPQYATKLAVMHNIPERGGKDISPWFRTLEDLVNTLQ
jgi:hypothetical protein